MFILEKIISSVAVHVCVVCEREGIVLCSDCAGSYLHSLPSRCFRCRALMVDSRVCPTCRPIVPLKHVWVRTGYEIVAKQVVHQFKFERGQAAAPCIAALMGEVLPYMPGIMVVPVPTATSRIRQRGYDHAVLLARRIAQDANLPCCPVLKRLGQTRQVGAHKKFRETQLLQAFRVLSAAKIKNQHVLLVDDVVTTGATLAAAARALKAAGAKSVSAVVFAQKE